MNYRIILMLAILSLLLACSAKKEQVTCTNFNYEKCPESCVVCPPCAACSSISCQTEEFCHGIGFNRSWYEKIKNRLNRY